MRRQDEYDLQPHEAVRFYPCLVPMCGGVGAALLFCWYEQIHREAGYPAGGVRRSNIREWRTGIGYTQTCQPWYQQFYRIGTIHRGSESFAAARRACREFISVQTGAYVFYALEITRYNGPCILHRNRWLIERRLAELGGKTFAIPSVPKISGSWTQAAEDVARISSTVIEPIDFHAKSR